MDLRNRRGAITPAEGCMFAAVALFVILLVGILVIVYLRFQDRPRSLEPPPGGASLEVRVAPHALGTGFVPGMGILFQPDSQLA